MAITHGSTAALMEREHGVLIRHIAGLQSRVSEEMQSYARQVTVLEREVITLRAQLLVVRTALLWSLTREGLSSTAASANRSRPLAAQSTVHPRMKEADEVICQTGCTGHAHPWLGEDGQCRRTGRVCDNARENAPEEPE